MRRFQLAVLSLPLALMLFMSLGPARSTAAPVRIAGTVINETHKKPAPGVTVQLLRPSGAKENATSVAKTQADARGRFDFGRLDLAADDLLIARARWQDYDYETPAYDGAARLKEMGMTVQPAQVRLPVFDSTKRLTPLSFTVHHIAIETRKGGLKCVERIVVENPSRRTFLGLAPHKSSVLIDLPPNAREVHLDPKIAGGELVKTQHGYAVAMPITPSTYNNRNAIIVHYTMDWPSWQPWKRELDLTRRAQYPTKFFFVARTEADRKLEVKAPQLSEDQPAPLPIDGQMETRLINAIGNPMGEETVLKAGQEIPIRVSYPLNPLFWAFLMFIVILFLLVPLTLLRSPRRNASSSTEEAKIREPMLTASVYGGTHTYEAPMTMPAGGDPALSAEASALIAEIAQLDDKWETGVIEADTYQSQRAMCKEKLVNLLISDE